MKGLDSMNEKYFDYVCYSIISKLSNGYGEFFLIIINEVEGINRVYDITSKPPGAIKWK